MLLKYSHLKTQIILFYRAHSLVDRITGFGPVDGGSIPPGPIYLAKYLIDEKLKILWVEKVKDIFH